MGFVSVTNAIGAYFTTGIGTIPFLSKVFEDPPKLVNGSDFYSAVLPGSGSGGILFTHVHSRHATRIGFGGDTSGVKMKDYETTLLVYGRSTKTKAENASSDFKQMLDGLDAYIEANRNLGAPTVIFQAGEGGLNDPVDLHWELALPRVTKLGIVLSFALGTMNVQEWVST